MNESARLLYAGAVGLAVFSVLSVFQACAGPGQYVWFDQLPSETQLANDEYLIRVGDTLSIHVLGHEEMLVKERVRRDGRISLLLIGDVIAKDKRPSALKAELEGRLKDYIVSPSVVVNVEETAVAMVTVLGEVMKPGGIPMDEDPRLAHVLALAGGLTDYAARNGIYLVRSAPRPVRIRFTYEAITRDVRGAGDFPLRGGDVLEVE
jgi:polysaccharide export outer membrane protein